MKTPQRDIDELLNHPSESLNVEVKSWLNPLASAGIAKIVRATFALRNRNGGFLIIGLDDKTLKPDERNKPTNVRQTYHTDILQGIISRYASSLFEIEVMFGSIDGIDIPVIVVPGGIPFPVVTKAHLDDAVGKRIVDFGQLYFRTLRTNGTPSTSAAQPQDWKDIVEICFENREADLGRFLRRLAGSSASDITTVLEGLAGTSGGIKQTLRDRTITFLNDGIERFSAEADSRKLSGEALRVAEAGSWEVSLVVDPQKTNELPTESFRQTLASSNPRYTGWPVWLDSSGFQERTHRPVVKSNGWETFIVSLDSWSKHIDFYRFDPNGRFYLRRNLQDDTNSKIPPGTLLDPTLVTIRIAEAVAVGLAFVKSLGWDVERTTIGFAARWSKLRGRTLETWANPMAYISPRGQASDETAVGYTQLNADTPPNAIAPAVAELIGPLLILFDGFEMPRSSVEGWVKRLLERSL